MVEDLATDSRCLLKLHLPMHLAAAAAIANYLCVQSSAQAEAWSLANKIFFLLFFEREQFVDAICQHRAAYNYGVRSRFSKLQSFVLCSGQMDPMDRVLIRLPFAVVVLLSVSQSGFPEVCWSYLGVLDKRIHFSWSHLNVGSVVSNFSVVSVSRSVLDRILHTSQILLRRY